MTFTGELPKEARARVWAMDAKIAELAADIAKVSRIRHMLADCPGRLTTAERAWYDEHKATQLSAVNQIIRIQRQIEAIFDKYCQ